LQRNRMNFQHSNGLFSTGGSKNRLNACRHISDARVR
jgi:hypothetical protein